MAYSTAENFLDFRPKNMQKITPLRYWHFGTCIRFLQDAGVGYGVKGTGLILENVDTCLTQIKELNLQVTDRACSELKVLRAELFACADDAKLSGEQKTKLTTQVSNVRLTLQAELQGFSAYVVAPKRLDVQRLLDNVPSLLAPGAFDELSEIAKFDLNEAGKCIAFERPTAAAFHLMRATEEVLRCYYRHFVKRDRLSPMLWFPMVKALQSHRLAKKNEILHKNLDNIRVSFRNPTQHPEKTYDIQEVQDLWGLCIDAIGRMHNVMMGK